MISDQALYEEMKTGPRAAGYAALIAAGNDVDLAGRLNARSIDLPADFPVLVTRAQIHLVAATDAWLPRVRRIADGRLDVSGVGDAAAQLSLEIACEAVMDMLQAGSDLPLIDLRLPTVQQVLGGLHAAAALTGLDDAALAHIDALVPAQCSAAEQLAGELGVSVDAGQVSRLLHADRQAAYEAGQAAIAARAAEILAALPEMDPREARERADQELHGADWGHV